MKTAVQVNFSGAVFSMHVYIGGHEIPVVKGASNKWNGKDDLDIIGEQVRVELKFIAPSFTDWSFSVKFGAKKVLDESGQSDTSKFSFSKLVDV